MCHNEIDVTGLAFHDACDRVLSLLRAMPLPSDRDFVVVNVRCRDVVAGWVGSTSCKRGSYARMVPIAHYPNHGQASTTNVMFKLAQLVLITSVPGAFDALLNVSTGDKDVDRKLLHLAYNLDPAELSPWDRERVGQEVSSDKGANAKV